MGYGPVINGRQRPISPWQGSWAQQQQQGARNPDPRPNPDWVRAPLVGIDHARRKALSRYPKN